MEGKAGVCVTVGEASAKMFCEGDGKKAFLEYVGASIRIYICVCVCLPAGYAERCRFAPRAGGPARVAVDRVCAVMWRVATFRGANAAAGGNGRYTGGRSTTCSTEVEGALMP